MLHQLFKSQVYQEASYAFQAKTFQRKRIDDRVFADSRGTVVVYKWHVIIIIIRGCKITPHIWVAPNLTLAANLKLTMKSFQIWMWFLLHSSCWFNVYCNNVTSYALLRGGVTNDFKRGHLWSGGRMKCKEYVHIICWAQYARNVNLSNHLFTFSSLGRGGGASAPLAPCAAYGSTFLWPLSDLVG